MSSNVQVKKSSNVSPLNAIAETSFFDVLANTESCGLFLCIDKVLQGHLPNVRAVYEILDILRNVRRHAERVRVPQEENVGAFVTRLLTASEELAMRGGREKGPSLRTCAMRLTECLNRYQTHQESSLDLQRHWEEFLLFFYRENLYVRLRR